MLLRLVAAQLDQADARVPAWAGTDLRSGRIVGHRAADLRTLSPPETFARRHYLLYKCHRLGLYSLRQDPSATGGL